MFSLGIDIGGTSVKVAGVSNGQVLWTSQSSPPYSLPTTEQLLQAMRGAIGSRGAGLGAVGMCVPGLLDRQKRIITVAVNVPGLQNIVLDDLAGMALGYRPAHIEIVNDANATAYDIWSTRQLNERLLVLAIGTGVGAAVIDSGTILKVEGDVPGHVGQIDVSLEGQRVIGPDGGAGSLEGYLGASAVAQLYGPEGVGKMQPGDPPFLALVRTIRICHAIYRPVHIVLSGGIGIRLQRLVPQIKAAVQQDLTSVARASWTLSCGQSDFHAAAGAARLATDVLGR